MDASLTPLDELQWRSPEWIQAFGLRTDNVLEYFAQSPFFDRSSNNQVLKMQSQFNENLHTRTDLHKELQNMKGIEFVISFSREPELWIVRKQNRLSPQEVRPISTYFVVNENIYMAPSVLSVIQSRLLSTVLSMRQALDQAFSLPNYSPSQGYTYFNQELDVNDSTVTTAPPITTTPPTKGKPALKGPISIQKKMTQVAPSPPKPAMDLASRLAAEVSMDRALSSALFSSTVFLEDMPLIPAPNSNPNSSAEQGSSFPHGSGSEAVALKAVRGRTIPKRGKSTR
ncbi:MED6-domain-containing protein [Nadsonia fulvescens var. elongata DSM 6958]|uniref:Mediator of RNA polymerase II transcription subunit 6 n=1 Tax=Nadsonia fulvescens var. elongata DSM 6958 TaxID=857566 RepID=A0A1E3PR34_9ASCO|nr:MED6-domain-containing protein [Nadsonia fulvescens var. elongata DSM 6958]